VRQVTFASAVHIQAEARGAAQQYNRFVAGLLQGAALLAVGVDGDGQMFLRRSLDISSPAIMA
jgi:hypothetical protein